MARRDRPTRWSFRTQLVLLTSGVTALGVLALTVVVQVVLARSATSSIDSVLTTRADSVIASIVTGPTGQISVPDRQLDAGVAVYDDTGELVAGAAPSSVADEYARLAQADQRSTRTLPGDDERRLLAVPFDTDGASGVVVVIERFAPYELAEIQALWVSVGAGVLMVLLAGALAAWVSRQALAPVVQMSESADEWSEHDLTHRFDLGGGTEELTSLGRTLDRLLDRVATAIRSEQRLTSELAHELRTPLAAISANADLLLLRPDLPAEARIDVQEISAAARRMGSTIDGLLDLARSGARSGDSCRLADAVDDTLAGLAPDPALEVVVRIDPAVRVALPTALVARAVSPVLENALAVARLVEVTTRSGPVGMVDVLVDDDGPGIATERRDRVFEPGVTTGTGSGLGLALARRVARSAGGDVTVEDGPRSTRLVVRLPLDPWSDG